MLRKQIFEARHKQEFEKQNTLRGLGNECSAFKGRIKIADCLIVSQIL